MPTVSIVVPIYNAEKYINECILSVLAQSYIDWELLLADDGSADASLNICNTYATIDSRIRVFSKRNTGVSNTRNICIDNARGKYLIFLDADDYWIDKSMLETFVDFAENNNVDLLRGDYVTITENGRVLSPKYIRPYSLSHKVISPIDFVEEIIHGEYFTPLTLFRKDVIGDLRFNEQRAFLEDMEFYSRLMIKGCSCAYLPLSFYAYRKHSQSATSQISLRNVTDSFSMSEVFYHCSKKAQLDGLKDYYEYSSVMMYYWTIESLVQGDNIVFYKNNREVINLKGIQAKVAQIAKEYRHHRFPFMVYTSPQLAICIMRVRYLMLNYIARIKRICLQIIKHI